MDFPPASTEGRTVKSGNVISSLKTLLWINLLLCIGPWFVFLASFHSNRDTIYFFHVFSSQGNCLQFNYLACLKKHFSARMLITKEISTRIWTLNMNPLSQHCWLFLASNLLHLPEKMIDVESKEKQEVMCSKLRKICVFFPFSWQVSGNYQKPLGGRP